MDIILEAAKSGDLELVQHSLDTDTHSLHVTSQDGDGPLAIAAANGHIEVVRLLLEKGACALINGRNNDGDTALRQAAKRGHHEIAKILLNHGADVHVTSRLGDGPLAAAADNGHIEVVNVLLQCGTEDALINARNFYGNTALIYAARRGYQEIAKLLLDNSADLEVMNTHHDMTALHFAIESGHVECVKLFLNKGAVFDRPNKIGDTPLFTAAYHSHLEIVKLLLEKGASPFDRRMPPGTLIFCGSEAARALLAEAAKANPKWAAAVDSARDSTQERLILPPGPPKQTTPLTLNDDDFIVEETLPVKTGSCSVRLEKVRCDRLVAAGGIGPLFVRKVVARKYYEHYEREVATMMAAFRAELTSEERRRLSLVVYFGALKEHEAECRYTLITEYCPHGDLDIFMQEHVSAEKPLDALMILRWASQLAEALDLIHSKLGRIHLDLKLSNILLLDRPDAPGPFPYDLCIADFGISQTWAPGFASAGGVPTLWGVTGASVAYFAPEQRIEGSLVTEAADVWQLGLVFLQLMCGRLSDLLAPEDTGVVGPIKARVLLDKHGWAEGAMRELVCEMLEVETIKRPAMKNVQRRIREASRQRDR